MDLLWNANALVDCIKDMRVLLSRMGSTECDRAILMKIHKGIVDIESGLKELVQSKEFREQCSIQ